MLSDLEQLSVRWLMSWLLITNIVDTFAQQILEPTLWISPTNISIDSPCCSRLHQILSKIQTRKVLQEFNLQDKRWPWKVRSSKLLSLDERCGFVWLYWWWKDYRNYFKDNTIHRCTLFAMLWCCVNCMRSVVYILSNILRDRNEPEIR